jgi:type II secretory pathway predicted ATPase ExeA
MSNYCNYFGFKSEPFTAEISAKNLLKLPSMVSVKERFDYVMNGGVFIVTGEVGSGKSTSLRWSQAQFHPSSHLFLNITASGGSLIEFYRQLCWDLDIVVKTGSRAAILKEFKSTVREIIFFGQKYLQNFIPSRNLITIQKIYSLLCWQASRI